MTITDAAVQTSTFDPTVPITNDFTIVVATENGSGSQTANNALIRAMFKMGIPVSGKNLFPSNIQGLPTWYSIRISKDGYTARRDVSEILVAYNPRTSEEDLSKLPSGGVCVHPADLKFANPRSDVVMYAVPVKELVKEINPPANLRDYIANMSYVGVLMTLLGIERAQISRLDAPFQRQTQGGGPQHDDGRFGRQICGRQSPQARPLSGCDHGQNRWTNHHRRQHGSRHWRSSKWSQRGSVVSDYAVD